MDIKTFHRYNRLVEQGLVKPLRCPSCDTVYVTRISEDADPLLQCFGCGSLIQPGLRLYSDVLAVVKEHNV
jgi:NAD-dependent SIR2 family protein deacetylase